MTTTKFAAFVQTPDGSKVRVMPRSRKTTLFSNIETATRALDNFSRKLTVNGYRGLIYATPYMPETAPIWTITL